MVPGRSISLVTYSDEKLLMTTTPISSRAIILLLAPLFFLASTFPYIQLLPSSSYTQPYALILGLILFSFSLGAIIKLRLSDQISIIGLAFVGVALFITTGSHESPQEYRYLLAFLSPLLLVPVYLTAIDSLPKFTIKILQISIAIWIIVSVVQSTVDPLFATFLLGHWGSNAENIISSGRGVLGLAPEPTHNAFHILLLGAALSQLDTSRTSRALTFGCIITATLLAASSSAILALLFGSTIWLLRRHPLTGLIVIIIGLFSLSYMPLLLKIIWGESSRLTTLATAFLESPIELLTIDYSVNIRLGGLIATLSESINSGFIPHGLSHETWLQARTEMLNENKWLFDLSLVGPPSGLGLLIFQGGIFVFPFLFMCIRRMLSTHPPTMFGQILVTTVPFIFLSQFYISSPLFSMVYACTLYKYRTVHPDQYKAQVPTPKSTIPYLP